MVGLLAVLVVLVLIAWRVRPRNVKRVITRSDGSTYIIRDRRGRPPFDWERDDEPPE